MVCTVLAWKIQRLQHWDATRLPPAHTNGCSVREAPVLFGRSPTSGKECVMFFPRLVPRTFSQRGRRNMSPSRRQKRHGFPRAVSKHSNIFGHYRKRFVFTKTSDRRESPRGYTSSMLK